MKKIFFWPLIGWLMLCSVATAASWPSSDSTGINVSSAVLARNSGFEPSGAVWHTGLGAYLVVGDDGDLAEISSTGALLNYWWVGGDLEDVTYSDPSSNLVYLADEGNSRAIEFNLSTGASTGRTWSFADYISQISGSGLEGLTWVPDGAHPFGTTPMGGLFYAGWQYDGDIFIYQPETSGASTYLYEIHTTSGYSDISGLDYDATTSRLYAIYDGLNLMEEWDTTSSTLLASYTLPGYDQEGVALVSSCSTNMASVLIAEDSGRIMFYNNYPITCPASSAAETAAGEAATPAVVDADSDGYDSTVDCNDTDASVYTTSSYYVDADGDGMGYGSAVSLCASSAPAGYTANNRDTNDLISDAGVEIYGDHISNDSDSRVDEVNTLTENGGHPAYYTKSPSASGAYGTDIISAWQQRNGTLIVGYADRAYYSYQVYSGTSSAATMVLSVNNTAYLGVQRGNQALLVNGYSGQIVASSTLSSTTRRALLIWAISNIH